MRYVGAKRVLLPDILSSRWTGQTREIPGLDISDAQVLKVESIRLESPQMEKKAESTLTELIDLIITDWSDSMRDQPKRLHQY